MLPACLRSGFLRSTDHNRMIPPTMELADSRQESARELAPAGPGSGRGAVDLFTFLSREAEKTPRRSAGLSVPQSAFDGSRLEIPCPGTGPLRRRSACSPACSQQVVSLPADVRAAASKPASSPATAPSPRLAAAPPMPSSLTPARCSEATPDELEERLRFFARQIKTFRKTSLMYSSPELMERIRQMEGDYETAVRQFYCRPPSTPGLQVAAAAAEQSTPGLQGAAAAAGQSTPGLQGAAAAAEGRRKRDASVHATGGLCDASAPAHTTEGLGDASAPAHATESLGDASAPAHATEGLCDASAPAHATEGPADASALAHVTEGPADASAPSLQGFSGKLVLVLASEPCEEEAPPDPVSGDFKGQFVLVLASEPLDEGFEEEAPPDPVSGDFKEQFVLVLASEPRDEGSPGAASASEGSPGSASASEGSPGSASASEGSPGSASESSPGIRGRPPELCACSGRPPGRPPELCACSGRPPGRPPELWACFWPSCHGPLRPPCLSCFLFLALLP
ncbi:hypothetical protein CRENBAI_014681 [Crenichthys baileyi]|uniref:Uncharacterized protein n=1 Tax=Crenichthys baileyi TaxID=28760 RepID=A0AAV9RRT9_9TELE